MAKLNIVLFEPEIPANTGNIGRTCVATGSRLHLIEPLGFKLNEKALKRAGMDYWKDLDVTTYINYEDFLEKNPGAKIYMAYHESPQSVHGSGLRAGLLYHVRKGERRHPGGNPAGASGDSHPHSHAAGYPIAESGEFRGHRAV